MRRLLLLLTGCVLAVQTVSGSAVELSDLIDRGELRARLFFDEGPRWPRSTLTLTVEIATQRWFSRGTRVRDFRVPGAVTRPYSSFADNQTRREGGTNWTVQSWRFRIYAMEPGELTVPDLSVLVSVDTAAHGEITGDITLPGIRTNLTRPPGAPADGNWLAAPRMDLREEWSDAPQRFLPGDAITRTRRFVVDDAPGMMLPDTHPEDIPGLSLYRAPAEVRDESDRGVLRGYRIETLIITLEQAGDYVIPGYEYTWYNTRRERFETLNLPAQRITVEAGDAAATRAAPAESRQLPYRVLWLACAGLLGVGLLLLAARRGLLVRLGEVMDQRSRPLRLRYRYGRALAGQNSVVAIEILHRRLLLWSNRVSLAHAVARDRRAAMALRGLLAHGYGREHPFPAIADLRYLYRCVAGPRSSPATATADLPQLNPR